MAVVGSLILTVAAIVASYPALVFLLEYFDGSSNSGALYVGIGFSVLAVILWISAVWGWFKASETGKS